MHLYLREGAFQGNPNIKNNNLEINTIEHI